MSSVGSQRKPARAVVVRDSTAEDVHAIAAIYDHAVAHGTASFEIDPPGSDEMARRRATVLDAGFPYLVAERDGIVVGYAYTGFYHKRFGYRFSIENSIYVDVDHHGRGVGHALLTALIERSETSGYRLMIAVIGDSGNLGSIRLHQAHGFVRAGTIKAVGRKFERWLDVVYMTRPLGKGSTDAPG